MLRPSDNAVTAVPGRSAAPTFSSANVPPVHSADVSMRVTVTGCRESGTWNPKIFDCPCEITVETPLMSSSVATNSAQKSMLAVQGFPVQPLRQSMRK